MTTTHRITTTLALALALGASAAPASALPTNINANGSEVPAIPTTTHAAAQATEPTRPVGTPATIVRVSAPNGFDWGDAAIGAGGGIALSIIGLGGVLAVSQHRTRRTPTPAA
jgi:hypothetical protein